MLQAFLLQITFQFGKLLLQLAGGGDIGVLFGTSEADLDNFIANGKRALYCSFDADGVTLEQH